jgi:hypothetical protein
MSQFIQEEMIKVSKKASNIKMNKNLLIAIVAVVAVILLIVVIAANAGKSNKNLTAQLNEEFTLQKNGSATIADGDTTIVFHVNSDLNYKEGQEFKVPYVITVDGVEYNGLYTFATGYSIHSEPNGMMYKANFLGIENGSLKVMLYKDTSSQAQ